MLIKSNKIKQQQQKYAAETAFCFVFRQITIYNFVMFEHTHTKNILTVFERFECFGLDCIVDLSALRCMLVHAYTAFFKYIAMK